MKRLCLLLSLLCLPLYASSISIIIDDVGDNQRLALRTLYLDKRVALSILPHTPFSYSIAELALETGNDVMLHQPMESHQNNHLLGPGPILTSMQRRELKQTLKRNLDAIPGVIGINNHMGSKLTENPTKMAWIMSELSQQGLFFLDSKTSANSIAADVASRWSVPNVSRHVFLDHVDTPEAIKKQFERLIQIARKHGHAIAIGHPKDNTLTFLEQALSQLDSFDVQLTAIRDVVNMTGVRPLQVAMPEQNCNILNDLKFHLNTLKQQLVSYRCNSLVQTNVMGE